MIAVPENTPNTDPVVADTLAIDVLLLLQLPPVVASDNVVESPTQTDVLPVITAGTGFTVIGVALMHPVDKVYVIDNVPDVTPVTIPVEPTVANAVLLLAQVPPPVASVSPIVDPTHTVAGPEIFAGNAFTVTVRVAIQPVGKV